MITSSYKRKGRAYLSKFNKEVYHLSNLSIWLLSRAGMSFIGGVSACRGRLLAYAVNRLGVEVHAFFNASERAAAKAFVYAQSLKSSPQLSLWGALV